MKMSFGKYAGRYLVDLPENYVLESRWPQSVRFRLMG
ncbi:MAG: hypothetical protein DRP70_09375 [Spirochaetes bacterium]|nr:MAG: hypothetical protein DRP70_09375 [Spirochaetota bacterium]